MATSLTKNLKLRINDNLTADAKYNLNRLDLLGTTFLVDTSNQLNIRSQTDLLIEPESADIGGSGIDGSVSVGTASHILANIDLWGQSVTVPVSLGIKDTSSTGNKYLRIKYASSLGGSVDTSADRTLSVDMEGADRSLILGGSVGVLGGDLTLNLTGLTSVVLPTTGTLSTLAGIETLTNKSMDGLENTFENIQYASLNLTDAIVNADVHSAAAIAYSKLNLLGSIINADISGSAQISYNKLALSNSILNADINSAAAIHYSKLDLDNKIQADDIEANAGIPYSKLGLGASIQVSDLAASFILDGSNLDLTGLIQNTDVASGAGIQYSKLALNNSIINSDISTSAAIAYSKLALSGSLVNTDINASAAIAYSKLNLVGGIVAADINSAAAIPYSKLLLTNSITNSDIVSNADIAYSKLNLLNSIQAADIATGAAIPYAKLDLSNSVESTDLVPTILNDILPDQTGNAGKVFSTDGTDTQWITVSGTGTVTSVALTAPTDVFAVSGSPVTATGTLDLSFQDQVANTVFAGPSTGADAAPEFRVLVEADIPTLPYSKLNIADGDLTIAKTSGLQTALDGKVDENAPITGATATKITYDAKGLVTAGAALDLADLPAGTVTETGAQTLTNKTLTSPVINTPTGIVKSDVGLGNVDNTSDSTKNSAVATLTNKTIVGDDNTIQDVALSSLKTVIGDANKALVRNASGVVISSFITNDNIDNGAAISFSKMIGLTADRVAITDGAGEITNSSITTTTLSYLDATSSIQTQLNGKQPDVITTQGDLIVGNVSGDAARLPIGTSGYTLISDGTTFSWQPVPSSLESFKADWVTADGTSKVVTHSLASTDVIVQVFDKTNGETIKVDTAIRTDSNTVTLTASEAPGAAGWRVLILAV